MDKKIITLLGIIFIFFSTNYLYATEKIAFIDLNYIYVNSKVGKKIIDETQKKQKIIEKESKDYQKKLDEEKENLFNQKNVLAKEEFRKKLDIIASLDFLLGALVIFLESLSDISKSRFPERAKSKKYNK